MGEMTLREVRGLLNDMIHSQVSADVWMLTRMRSAIDAHLSSREVKVGRGLGMHALAQEMANAFTEDFATNRFGSAEFMRGCFGPAMTALLRHIVDEYLGHPQKAAQVDDLHPTTQEFILRGMARNYKDRHCWDQLGKEACEKGADEIRSLRLSLAKELAHPRPAVPERACGCPCEPSGSDGLRCPDTNGRLLCDPAAPESGGG